MDIIIKDWKASTDEPGVWGAIFSHEGELPEDFITESNIPMRFQLTPLVEKSVWGWLFLYIIGLLIVTSFSAFGILAGIYFIVYTFPTIRTLMWVFLLITSTISLLYEKGLWVGVFEK